MEITWSKFIVTLSLYAQFNTNKLVDVGIDIAVLLLIIWYLHYDTSDVIAVLKFDNVIDKLAFDT